MGKVLEEKRTQAEQAFRAGDVDTSIGLMRESISYFQTGLGYDDPKVDQAEQQLEALEAIRAGN